MACVNSTTFYWAGSTFAAATQIYTDSNLTTVAPDGWYQQGGIYREMVGGVLGGATTCPTCIVQCDTTISGSGGEGQYFLSAYVGPATGVVLASFDPYSFPDKCTWSFDYDNSGTPTVASEYSSSTEGYLQGLIGTIADAASQCSPPPGGYTNAAGSSGQVSVVDRFDYDVALAGFPTTPTSVGTQTLGPYDPQGGGPNPVDFTTNAPGYSMMVIPKPNAFPDTIDFIFDGPCAGTGWRMFITCPVALNSFTCKPSPQPCTATPLLDPFFTAHPGNINSGAATAVFVNDWAFVDQYGVTIMPAGDYLVDNGTAYQCVTVGPNGVVTAVSPCSGTC